MSGKCLPVGWIRANLEDLCEILDSRRVPVNAKDRESRVGDVPYYGATGQVGWIDDCLFDEDLVLLGEDGAPFLDPLKPKAYRIHGASWVNNHAHVLRPRAGVEAGFLFHHLNAVEYNRFVTGSTRLKLPQAAMRLIPLNLAPQGEQRRIVAALEERLSDLDAATDSLERARSYVGVYRATLRRSAVEGQLIDGRENSRNRRGGPQPWSPSVPQHWAWATVDQLAEVVEYGSSTKTHDKGDVAVLRMGNIVDGELSWDKLRYLPRSHEEFPKLFLKKGDIVFNRTNSPELVGKTAVVDVDDRVASFASYLLRVRLLPRMLPDFFAAFLNSTYSRAWISAVVTQQVGQANVNGSKLRALQLPVPPLDEQRAIVAEMKGRLTSINRLAAEIDVQLARAARLRQSILKHAFEGKLVPQDPSDEPASVLLDRIRRERPVARVAKRRGRR